MALTLNSKINLKWITDPNTKVNTIKLLGKKKDEKGTILKTCWAKRWDKNTYPMISPLRFLEQTKTIYSAITQTSYCLEERWRGEQIKYKDAWGNLGDNGNVLYLNCASYMGVYICQNANWILKMGTFYFM